MAVIVNKFLIAGGNATLLVSGVAEDARSLWTQKYLREGVEQIGFIDGDAHPPILDMMGGELCVNATLAHASLCTGAGTLRTSGHSHDVYYENSDKVLIVLHLPHERESDIVLFEGIGYLCTTEAGEITKERLARLAQTYSLPAFGVVAYDGSRITPYVYVVRTDSLVAESACGSGSIAIALVTGATSITQPTGEVIEVLERDKGVFSISARVDMVGEWSEE